MGVEISLEVERRDKQAEGWARRNGSERERQRAASERNSSQDQSSRGTAAEQRPESRREQQVGA